MIGQNCLNTKERTQQLQRKKILVLSMLKFKLQNEWKFRRWRFRKSIGTFQVIRFREIGHMFHDKYIY